MNAIGQAGRALWIILDGVGVGALPDAAQYGDAGAATLQHVANACDGLSLPTLQKLGLGHLGDIAGVPAEPSPIGGYGRMAEKSAGKDSTTGHWELAGVPLAEPFATFPTGFPDDLIETFRRRTGLAPLGNVAASGTNILGTYGAEHVRTGRPIVYTSVDSVFQIAAHESVIPPEQLYALCRAARAIVDDYRIGRVIARPFEGGEEEGFRRTARRKDFSLPPPEPTLLDHLAAAGRAVRTVGKVHDLFTGRGIATSVSTSSNADGMARILGELALLESGELLLANLIDFDMAFGHRNDARGFGQALEEFDAWLPALMERLVPGDLLMVTADHGCDPTVPGTDHTREFVPVLTWTPGQVAGVSLGTRESFADAGATLADFLGVSCGSGASFLAKLQRGAA